MEDFKAYSNTEILHILGERLRQYRLNLKLTQKELAESANISLSTLQRFEAGTLTNMNVLNLFAIMREIGIIDYADEMIPPIPESPYGMRNRSRTRKR